MEANNTSSSFFKITLSVLLKYFVLYYAYVCRGWDISIHGKVNGMYRITVKKRDTKILKHSICIYGILYNEHPILLYNDGRHFAYGWQYNFIRSCREANIQKSIGELAEERNNIHRLRLSANAFTQRL
jgi:hypothetical protein